MLKNITVYILLQISIFLLVVTCLSTVKLKGVRLWSFLNENVILEGGQTKLMFDDLEKLSPNSNTLFVIGSSRAYRGYDPRIFKASGIELFNMGTSGQNMKDSYTLLKLNHTKIKKLILDFYPGVLMDVTEESTLMLIQNAHDARTALKMLENNITINSINNMASRVFDLNHKPLPCQENYIYNGYVEKAGYFKIDTNRTYEHFIPGENFVYLDSVLNFVSRKKIKIWLASHPVKWNMSYKNYYQHSYLPQVQKILSKYPAVDFFDFTLNHSNSDSLFSDASHLNQKGVDYYDTMLLQELQRTSK